MKKKVFSLMCCSVMFTMNPLFAMEEDSEENQFSPIRLESIAYKKEEKLFRQGWYTYSLNIESLRLIMKTPYPSSWRPTHHNLFGKQTEPKSYTFLMGEKQLELCFYSTDDTIKLPLNFCLHFRGAFEFEKKDRPILSEACNNCFIREITLPPDNPMCGKGEQLNGM